MRSHKFLSTVCRRSILTGCFVFFSISGAYAQAIQMIPPTTEATNSSATPNRCPPGSPQVLTWDGQHALTCAANITASGGNLGVGGNATVAGVQPRYV